jgi:superfamily II DNA or RNA helicase
MKLRPLQGEISARLVLKSPPRRLRDELTALYTFPNPAYEQAARYSPYGYVSARVPETLSLTALRGSDLLVPRGVNVGRLSAPARAQWRRIEWQDARVSVPVRFPQFLAELNKEQKYLYGNFESELRNNAEGFGAFLYVSPTGTGKTILMLRAAKETGQRTLILFSTEQIKRAWYKGISLAFGLAPNDIGMIQKSKWRIGDYVTLASIATLARRKARWSELFAEFGTLVVDEADTVGAPSFWQFISECPARYVIGATATENGDKGANHYLRACFGKTRCRVLASTKDTATSMAVRRVEMHYTKFAHNTPSSLLDWNELSEALMTDEERNRLIIHHVIKDYRNGERILLVTKRLVHVEVLVQMLRERGITTVSTITGATNADNLYTEKMLEGVLNKKVPIVVATIAAIKRGANLNPLSVLHLGMPTAGKNTLEQLIGRIRRRASGKTECKVVYYLDGNTSYLFSLFKRVAVPVFRRLKIRGFDNLYIS